MKTKKLKYPQSKKAKINYGSSIVPNYWLYLGIIIVLGVLGYFGYRYQQSNVLTRQTNDLQNSENELGVNKINSSSVSREQLSPEDLSIAADLGNIDVILEEMEQSASQQNFVSVRDISRKKDQKPSKYRSKIDRVSSLDLLNGSTENTSASPLSKTLDRSSVQTVIESSSTNSKIPLSSVSQHSPDNNESSTAANSSLSSIDRSYVRKTSSPKENLNTINASQSNTIDSNSNNNLNSVSDRDIWRTNSKFNKRLNSNSSVTNRTGSVNNLRTPNFINSTQLPTGQLSDYQINLQDFNRLVPRNYLASPRTDTQVDRIQNNQQSIVEVPTNNLSDYRLQPQGLDRLNLRDRAVGRSNLSPNSGLSRNIDLPNSNSINNSGLQPSSPLQPSGTLSIGN